LAFGINADAVGIKLSGQFRRIFPPIDIGNLRGGKSNYFIRFILAVKCVEIVKIAPGGAHNNHFGTRHFHSPSQV